jgi:hypothetical protein
MRALIRFAVAQRPCKDGEGIGYTVKGGIVMDPAMLKRFEKPDEVRAFAKGKFEILHLGGMMLGRTSYKPGVAGLIPAELRSARTAGGGRPHASLL